ncbi:unnamed protein product [Lactuca saligna]|uniref:C3HC-type domain-containing protein n=1 Tax=Lactuca saligna TaxID=75948 RepID=A0AA36EEJ5_LACSI|nr:unnamed protein product [Lactuca saligna]
MESKVIVAEEEEWVDDEESSDEEVAFPPPQINVQVVFVVLPIRGPLKVDHISKRYCPLLFRNSSPRPPTPAASSRWGRFPCSCATYKCFAGASSPVVATNAGSTYWLGHGQGQGLKPSSIPWERGDLLRRLSTFQLANWFGKPKVASSLSYARRGWVNVDINKIEYLGEEFSNQLDEGHKLVAKTESHQVLKPTEVHSKIPINVDQLVGLSKLILGDSIGDKP